MLNATHFGIIIFSFISALLLGILFIPILRKIKFGQTVRDDGPKSHLKKMGVPTMGGVIFLLPLVFVTVFYFSSNPFILPLTFSTIAFGIIGFIDDYIKVVRKRKDGLYPKQKTFLQVIVGTIFAIYIVNFNIIDNVIHLPNNDIYLPKGILILFIIIFLYATTNAVNLTDGVDGLLASVTLVVLLSFIVITIGDFKLEYIRIFCFALIGGCLGYLVFNKYPSSVIMGDLGSLALGGAVGSLTILLKTPIILIFFGIIYVIEALSVIIQVTSFKLRGKRIFKMSPIHHHFELLGWRETKVVRIFVGFTILFCIIGILMYNITIR